MDSEKNTNMKESQPVRSCISCGTTTTPLWRAGPTGPKSMCNRCGIKWTRAMAKKLKKKSKSSVGSTHFKAVIVPSDDSISHSTENSYDERKSNGASTRYQKTKTVKPKGSPIINPSKRKEAPRTSPRKKTVTTSRRAAMPKTNPNPLEPYLFLNAAVNEYQSMNERMMFQQSLSELQQEIDYLKQENQHQQELLNHWRSEASEISMPSLNQELSESEASTAMDNMLDLSND